MDRNQLNSLVFSYQNGSEVALNEIFQEINPLIEKASADLETVVTDVTKFDCRMILKVKKLAEDFSEETKDFKSIVKTLISREKSDFAKRRSKQIEEISIDKLQLQDEEGKGFQFSNSKAGVESEVLFQEKITLLAQGDSRKEMVLIEWSKGAEDKSISKVLAHRFGGKPESHRKFISRFKTECRNRLESKGL